MTAVMYTDPVRKARRNRLDFQYVGEKLDQLEYFFANCISRCRTFLRVQVVLDVQNATCRWRYDIIVGSKILNEQLICLFREMLKAGVCHRLTAAGLSRWIRDVQPQFLQ